MPCVITGMLQLPIIISSLINDHINNNVQLKTSRFIGKKRRLGWNLNLRN